MSAPEKEIDMPEETETCGWCGRPEDAHPGDPC